MKKALIIVDLQNDFCEGGALAVPGAKQVIPKVLALMDSGDYARIVATADLHPQNHVSFAKNHEKKKIGDVIDIEGRSQVLWPVHCVDGTIGSELRPELAQIAENPIDIIIPKGGSPLVDSYSGFQDQGGAQTGLDSYLRRHGITHVDVVGLALDYCVKETALDALLSGYKTTVILAATKAVTEETGRAALETLRLAGVEIKDGE